MKSFTVSAFAMILMLAGQALAQFVVTVGTQNFTATELLDLPSSMPVDACKTQCDPARQNIQACGDDTSCLCREDTVASLLTCEQCMLIALIVANIKMPDPRVGNQVVLAGYAAACNASNPSVTLNATQTALAIPTADLDGKPFDWAGPSGIFLPLPALVFAVGTATLLGCGSLYLLSNL
ncbi:uncharacterized protein SCHCODRAFT_02639108 [Schizophyllum commune H4-8]|uniref:Expressed protein n=1 Tax=Schizophyllum commune (strain H4-8 / FGSC 9210) TaxID=578458 RepID=D8QG16_SCHCM|nr:uncharacterized protein SCHCODRAFT_02639108 [Schizophyllum commune H4-8]KAI5887870.1 hypothetical protein SCHCODRAFT_02639108 [Schizophyllum commune H4-8]